LVVGWTATDKWHGVKGATREESPDRVPVVAGKAKPEARKLLERETPDEVKTGMRATNPQSPSPTEAPGNARPLIRSGAPYSLARSSDAVLGDANIASRRRDLEDAPIARPRPELARVASTDTPRREESAPSEGKSEDMPRIPAGLPTSGIAIAIDKDTFRLTLYRDGEPLRTIPIAVGANDTTPVGVFTVANKLTNPVWHNRGEGVPPGDPRNPLGKRWLGLAQNGSPTSYGIHGAADPSRVGTPFGDGCLRLHPDDLETVFRLCPVGSVVLISP
jgi:lipoprotein-anchoring transpeptidase ErfK/SrfK